jgi:proteasome accessory factor C
VDQVRTAVDEALQRTVAVAFTYHAPDAAPTRRTVDPVTVHIADGEWYLQGWCHLRRAMRTFHLDRVSEITVTDIPAAHAHDSVPALFQPGQDDELAQLRFPEPFIIILGDVLAHAEIAVADGRATATMRVADPRGLRRLAARFGGEVEVIAPEDARRATRDWAGAALAQYSTA